MDWLSIFNRVKATVLPSYNDGSNEQVLHNKTRLDEEIIEEFRMLSGELVQTCGIAVLPIFRV